jgi:hypothetical protein
MDAKINEYRILVGKSLGKEAVGRLSILGESIKIDLTETACEEEKTEVAQGRIQ